MGEQLVTGVDIGGTKTHVALRRGAGRIIDRVVPTASWRTLDLEADAKALSRLVTSVSSEGPVAALAIGAHGCDSDAHCEAMRSAMVRSTGLRVTVVNDSELMVPAAGFTDGIGVVAGTGSIAVARSRAGEMLTAGGWGWILGDEGSASALVREAARAVRGALDEGDRTDLLIRELLSALGTDDPTKLGRLLDATRGAAVWGSYAGAVFRAADAGSTLARRVVREGGQGLAALVGVLAKRGADASRVVAGGGVIVEQPSLFAAFAVALREVSPSSELVLLREPPVLGALALARRLLDTPVTAS